MKRLVRCAGRAVLLGGLIAAAEARAACSYFSALDRDVTQPSQRALITWDPEQKSEAFTVQPAFKGNADDFGMVIPTPARPTLKEAPREIFKDLALYTILEPRPCRRPRKKLAATSEGGGGGSESVRRPSTVRILEAGVVGTLDYKIVTAERADDLYDWLKEHKYSYAGDEETLGFYVKKKWFFTVMKIDPKQMKRAADGTYQGDVSPTRFQFRSEELIYPLRITSLSVKDQTEALFYILAPAKMQLLGSKLEYAKRLKGPDLARLDRGQVQLPRPAIMGKGEGQSWDFKGLKGWIREGQFLTKVRRVYRKEEMTDDLVIGPAGNETEYTSYEDCGGDPP
ncbi:MAG TPA: DUF2330 domain-containing protein [Myxococcales bacterium]|nr:DUF2330 domain-containing protein [Myxococcales bacterium]